MNAQRLWPAFQTIGRTLVCNRADIFNYSIRAHNSQSIGNPNVGIYSQSSHPGEQQILSQNLLKTGRGSYVKVITQKLSTGTYLFCREFNDGENEHAHDILCSIPAYEGTVLNNKKTIESDPSLIHWKSLLQKSWLNVENSELVESFSQLSKLSSHHSLKLEDEQFNDICSILSERIQSMTDDQIIKLLESLAHWPPSDSKNSSNYLLLWNSLDATCASRIRAWNISKIFFVADHWYALRLSKMSIFFAKLMQMGMVKLSTLTSSQLVQFMFYANLNRDIGSIHATLLKNKIIEALKEISIEELGIIAMGLFKTQTNIRDDYLNIAIINMTRENLHIISNHALGSILKFLNKNFLGNAYKQCENLLHTINPHMDQFNNLALLQIALLGNNLLVFNEEVMEKIGARFGNCIPQLRLKDLERFTYTLMLYKFIPRQCPNVVYDIIEELRKPERIVEINHFPKCFVSCVNYIVTMGILPLDLVSASLQPSMIQLLQYLSYDEMGRELSEMNWSLSIEGPPDYKGYRLDPDLSLHLTKKHLGRIPTSSLKNLTYQERLFLDVEEKLGAMLGSKEFLMPAIILPHFSHPDIIFCTDHTGEPLKIPYEYRYLPFEALKLPIGIREGFRWNAVMIGGRNSYIRETRELKGNLEVKRRQLQKLGYQVSVVPYNSYSKRSTKYRLGCLENILKHNSSLQLEGRVQFALNTFKSTAKYNVQSKAQSEV